MPPSAAVAHSRCSTCAAVPAAWSAGVTASRRSIVNAASARKPRLTRWQRESDTRSRKATTVLRISVMPSAASTLE